MKNVFRVNVSEPFYKLFEDELCVAFFEAAAFTDVVEEIPTCADFHDVDEVLGHFECF